MLLLNFSYILINQSLTNGVIRISKHLMLLLNQQCQMKWQTDIHDFNTSYVAVKPQ